MEITRTCDLLLVEMALDELAIPITAPYQPDLMDIPVSGEPLVLAEHFLDTVILFQLTLLEASFADFQSCQSSKHIVYMKIV